MRAKYRWLLACVALVLGISLIMSLSTSAHPSAAAPGPAPAGVLAASTPTPTSTPCAPGWSVVTSQNVGTHDNFLRSVAAVSPNDVWAVGYYSATYGYQNLIEHWNGTQWSIVPSPNPGWYHNQLLEVYAVSANDIWAIGQYTNDLYYGGYHVMTLHWDGSVWSAVPNGDPGGNYTAWLRGVDGTASNDVWAVGFYREYSPQALIMHWNGSMWSVVSNPVSGIYFLGAVAAISPNDAWAIGSTNGPPTYPIAWHWNGSAWSVASDPGLGALYDIDGVASNDVWAAGANGLAHWNGSTWTTVSNPNIGSVSSIDTRSSNDAWALGANGIFHWDGSAWNLTSAPPLSGLNDVSGLSPNEAWAVGNYQPIVAWQTLTEHYTGIYPTPTPTTPPTNTPTPPCGSLPTWTPGALRTPARYAAQGAFANDGNPRFTPIPYFYVVGGLDANNTPIADVSRFNPVSNAWGYSPPLPVAAGRVALGGTSYYLYEAGGYLGGTGPGSVTNVTRMYSAFSGVWASVAAMPQPVEGGAGTVLNGKFYVLGGDNYTDTLATNYIYDIGTDHWSTGAPLPAPRKNAYTTTQGGLVYLFGGVDSTGQATDTLFAYNPTSNSWTTLASPNTGGLGNYGGISPYGDNYLIVVDGGNTTGIPSNTTHIYNIAANTWIDGPTLITGRMGMAQGTLGDGRIIVYGGLLGPGSATGTTELLRSPCLTGTPTPTRTWTYTPTPTPTYTPTATPPCGLIWRRVNSPNPTANENYLYGVAAVSPNDVWAVGYYVFSGTQLPVIEHWNGTSWSIFPSPKVSNGLLWSVTALAADDVWAVGWIGQLNASSSTTLIEHWDGTQWSVVLSPNVGTDHNRLYGVAAASANDIWAVGFSGNPYVTYLTLVEHWDGAQWSIVPSPNGVTSLNQLMGVAVVAANDVWAVGEQLDEPLTEHWDGTQWTIVPSQDSWSYAIFTGVAAVRGVPNAVWAVGYYDTPQDRFALIERWDGTQWTAVPNTPRGQPTDVTAISPNDVWAVGYTYNQTGYPPLSMHWNGSAWSTVTTPAYTYADWLGGVAATSSTDVWAVGYDSFTTSNHRTLIDRYYDPCTSPTSTLTATPTATPTCPPVPITVGQNQPAHPALVRASRNATSSFAKPKSVTTSENSKLKTQNSKLASPITFILDDGTRDTSIGFGADPYERAALWLNRFTPPASAYPITINGIQVLWPDQSATGDNLPGKTARLVVYQDADGDGNPSNATLLGQANVVIANTEVYENYPVNIVAPGPTGDLYIGFEDLWAEPGWTPRMYPASQDTTTSQARSWIAAMGSGAAPDINNLGNNDVLATIDSFDLPGNWLIRATGNTAQGGCPPTRTPTFTVTPSPTSTLTQTPTPTATCRPFWSIVSSPNVSAYDDYLKGVSAVSANDIWAVGYSREDAGPQQIETQHWDGTQWSVVPSPQAGAWSYLYGVSALSSSNVWAVGYSENGTLIIHWDGAQWSVVLSPSPGGSSSYLNSVDAVAANDVWAVGYAGSYSGPSQTLIEHWDGAQWSVVPSPNPGAFINRLDSVVALASNDVWAVGMYNNTQDSGFSLTQHWDGTQWSVVPSPNYSTYGTGLYAVAALSATDVWAVGNGSGLPIAIHWDGVQWTLTLLPNPISSRSTGLVGIAAVSTNDIWLAGHYINVGTYETLIEHWNGLQWSIVYSPNPPYAGYSELDGIAAVFAGDIWAVGRFRYQGSGPYRTLTEHESIVCGISTQTPTSTPTLTPTLTPTFTPTPQHILVGHLTWQGPPAQPDPRQQQPVTLTLKLGMTEINYPAQTTDSSGYFTVSVGGLSSGTYNWRAKGAKYLANSGTVALTGASVTNVEMGLLRTGDANNDNVIGSADFNILKGTFGKGIGDPGYDARADFTNDNVVNLADFNPLKTNFGQGGAPPVRSGK